MIILIDLDDVLADFDGGFYSEWNRRFPEKFIVPPEKRTKFYLREEMPEDCGELIREIITTEGFLKSLPEIPGGVDAVHQMKEMGHEVFICTSPFKTYKHCVTEKYAWVEEHLGSTWIEKLILTNDKTLITGDFLIDDKPEITGCLKPAWEHILYDRSYNRYIKNKKKTYLEKLARDNKTTC